MTKTERRNLEDLVFLVANSAIIGLGIYLCLDENPYGYLVGGVGLAGLATQVSPSIKRRTRTRVRQRNVDVFPKNQLNPSRSEIEKRLAERRSSSFRREVLFLLERSERQHYDWMSVLENLSKQPIDVFTITLPSDKGEIKAALEKRWDEITALYADLCDPQITILSEAEEAHLGYAMMTQGWNYDANGDLNCEGTDGHRHHYKGLFILKGELNATALLVASHLDNPKNVRHIDESTSLSFDLFAKLPDAYRGG